MAVFCLVAPREATWKVPSLEILNVVSHMEVDHQLKFILTCND